jgi:hypothetical protein
MIYPFSGLYSNSLDGNIPASGKIFDNVVLSPNLSVIKPALNTTIRIYNPGLDTYLVIGDISIYSMDGVNLVRPNAGTIVTTSSSQPFQSDITSWGSRNVIDGNPYTLFRGGFDLSSGIDKNSYLEITLAPSTNTNVQLISSITITGSPTANNSLDGMKMRILNRLANDLNVSTIKTLNADLIQTFTF